MVRLLLYILAQGRFELIDRDVALTDYPLGIDKNVGGKGAEAEVLYNGRFECPKVAHSITSDAIAAQGAQAGRCIGIEADV